MKKIYIDKLELLNIGGFDKEINIGFTDKTTVILGVNGSGKTTILEELFNIIRNAIGNISKSNNTYRNNDISLGKTNGSVKGSIITSFDSANFTNFEYEINLGNIVSNGNDKIKENINFNQPIQLIDIYPVIRYFKDEKQIDSNNSFITGSSFNNNYQRNKGYENCSIQELDISGVTNFIIELTNLENAYKIEKNDLNATIKEVQYLNNTAAPFFEKLYNKPIQIKVGRSKYAAAQCLIFKFKDIDLEFFQLSSGEKYLFTLVLELIYRNITLNPNNEDYSNTPGIVLIDEIEDHLHPRWQLNVIDALETAFPNIQFIVSTHSPLIASSVRREQIVAISNFEIIPSEALVDIYSDSSDEILENLMFSDNKISKFEEERKEIQNLYLNDQYDLAEKKLEALKLKVGSYPKWISDFENIISFAKS